MIPRNALLESRDGRRLLCAQLLDWVGNGISWVALPWLVLDGGAGPAVAGLVFAAGTLPYVVFGLLAGVRGDRGSRRRTIVTAHALQAVAAAVVPVVALAGHPPALLALAASFAIGSGRVFADAAAFGAVSEIVGKERFVEGQGALSTAWAAGLLCGPFLGGLLVGLVGPAETLAAEAASFALAAVLVASIRRPLAAPSTAVREGAREAIVAGLRVIRHTPLLWLLTQLTLLWNLAIVGADTLLVPLLRESIGLSSTEAGWVLGAAGIAGLLSGLYVGVAVDRVGGPVLLAGGILLSGAAVVALALAPGLWVALPANLAFGLAGFVASTVVISERQRHAPDHLQARVGISGRTIALTTFSLTALATSGLAALIDLRVLFLGFGIATLLVGAWASVALARFAATEGVPAAERGG